MSLDEDGPEWQELVKMYPEVMTNRRHYLSLYRISTGDATLSNLAKYLGEKPRTLRRIAQESGITARKVRVPRKRDCWVVDVFEAARLIDHFENWLTDSRVIAYLRKQGLTISTDTFLKYAAKGCFGKTRKPVKGKGKFAIRRSMLEKAPEIYAAEKAKSFRERRLPILSDNELGTEELATLMDIPATRLGYCIRAGHLRGKRRQHLWRFTYRVCYLFLRGCATGKTMVTSDLREAANRGLVRLKRELTRRQIIRWERDFAKQPLRTTEIARLLEVKNRNIVDYVLTGHLKGEKDPRAWTFLPADVTAFLRAVIDGDIDCDSEFREKARQGLSRLMNAT